MKSHLPQHSEKAFRKYEDYINVIIKQYPEPSNFEVPSPNTFLARIRDAVKSIALNQWESKKFKTEEAYKVFNILDGPFVFSHAKNGIYCGPKESLHFEDRPIIASLADTQIDASDLEVFNAIIVLKEKGIIKEPLKLANLSDFQIRSIKASPFLEFKKPNILF